MSDTINRILEIDARAQQKLSDAYHERDEQKKAIDAEAAESAEQLRIRCEHRIQLIYDQEQAAYEESAAAAEQELKEALHRLDSAFAEGRDGWLSEIIVAVKKD